MAAATPNNARTAEQRFNDLYPDYLDAKKALFKHDTEMLVNELGLNLGDAFDTVRARFDKLADELVFKDEDPAAKIYQMAQEVGYTRRDPVLTDVQEYDAYQAAMGRSADDEP